MKRNTFRAALVTLGIIVLPLTIAQSANAAIIANQAKAPSISHPNLIQTGTCWKRLGPYTSQDSAYAERRRYQKRGFNTSNVYGEGGLYSQSRNRRYYFKVFYRC